MPSSLVPAWHEDRGVDEAKTIVNIIGHILDGMKITLRQTLVIFDHWAARRGIRCITTPWSRQAGGQSLQAEKGHFSVT